MKEIFTIPDLDLSQESSVDPMGLQVIWTAYGQEIFGEKLTTIANDLRVFTFNLFHNHLINRLYQDYSEEMQGAKAYYKSWQTEFDVKSGLLIFLEDLVTWVFFKHEINADSDSNERLGILGLSKARISHYSMTPDKIYLSANKRSGLLKNQLNLGMTGRYKGPMMNMQFFDRTFTYIPKTWEQVDKFMFKWNEAMELEENLLKLITKHVFNSGKKEYPQLSLQELKGNRLWKPISEGYFKCFGSRKLPRIIKDYWKDRIGLNSGAPEALYNEIGKLRTDEFINHEHIFLNAKRNLQREPLELIKVNQILVVEPFLSHSEYLLRYISQPGIKTFKEEENNIEILRGKIIESSNLSVTDSHNRLKELYSIMVAQGPTSDWLKGVLNYHKNIMMQRGGNAWIELDEQNNFKHYFAPVLSENMKSIKKYLIEKPWLHRYYLETLRSIYNGLN